MTIADPTPPPLAAAPSGAVALDLGHVISETLRVLGSQFLPLGALALVFVFLPQALAGLAPPSMKSAGNLAGLLSLIFNGGGALIAYRAMTGGAPMTFGEASSAGGKRFGALFGLSLLTGLATLLGLALLIAPGVFLIAAWMPALGVVMVEGKPVMELLRRAWGLTEGARWRLAALAAIVLALYLVLMVVIVVTAMATGAGAEANASPAPFALVVDVVVIPLAICLISAVTTVGAIATYVELRRLKEGGVESELAQVFS